jgi:NADPH2:quinone reductase
MKAIYADEAGDPSVLKLVDRPDPSPGPGQVLIRVAFAGVNFLDVQRRAADAVGVPGVEGAGVVAALGDGVDGFAEGQRVAWMMSPGGYAELAAVDAERVVPIPDGVDESTAAAVLMQGVTAHYLSEIVTVAPGDTAVVHAAAGGVGGLLVQLLRQVGARVLGTVGSERKAELALESGVEAAIRYDRADFGEEIRRLTDGAGAHVIYDAIGKDTVPTGLRALRPRGALVYYGSASGQAEPIAPSQLQQLGSLRLVGGSLAVHVTDGQLARRAASIFESVAAGGLKVRIDDTLPLAEAAEAHRRLEGRATAGKLLLTVAS